MPTPADDHHADACPQRVASRHEKIDDDDGHYIVVDGTELTERCKPQPVDNDDALPRSRPDNFTRRGGGARTWAGAG